MNQTSTVKDIHIGFSTRGDTKTHILDDDDDPICGTVIPELWFQGNYKTASVEHIHSEMFSITTADGEPFPG